MTTEIDDLIAWFHGQFIPCTHPKGSPNQCEVWAERFAQTAGWISPAQAEQLSDEWEKAARQVTAQATERANKAEKLLRGIEIPNDPGLPTASTLDLISNLIDRDPCDWDHNHSCQAHGYFYLPQGVKCPQQEAKDLLAANNWCSVCGPKDTCDCEDES